MATNHIDTETYDPEKTCFVISPIGEDNSDERRHADGVFDDIIAPAAEAFGLVPLRADKIGTPGMITTQITRHIMKDKIIVADLTDHNANVFYELGLCHAFNKPTVHLILSGHKLPFDVQGSRTVFYKISDPKDALKDAAIARQEVKKQIGVALQPNFQVESPVTIAAQLEEFFKSTKSQTDTLFEAILNRINEVDRAVAFMKPSDEGQNDWINLVQKSLGGSIDSILQRYENEIDLLRLMRDAGVIGVFRQREAALNVFTRYIDEEDSEIIVIGSSLKGLLQRPEFQQVAEKLKAKSQSISMKFLLTHPVVADFRAPQESRIPTEIGRDIITTLNILKSWGVPYLNVRLYLGTPTYFAMKTKRHMLINPYSYGSRGYESPCFILASSEGAPAPNPLFDQFKANQFEAWDTVLAVSIPDYDQAIAHLISRLEDYAQRVDAILMRGRSFE